MSRFGVRIYVKPLLAWLLYLGVFMTARMNAQSLAWDAVAKDYTAKPGETNAHLTFSFTNASGAEVIIKDVRTSCGCTTASVPALPWSLAPKTNGVIQVNMDLRGRRGAVTKTVFVETPEALFVLTCKIVIPEDTPDEKSGERMRNQEMAKADRQAVFKGECAKCHADRIERLKGTVLFIKACAVCHTTTNRASMVPDLKEIPHPTDREYWKQWITSGKEGSLMPAFAKTAGGPLTGEQIESLVAFLVQSFPSLPPNVANTPAKQ